MSITSLILTFIVSILVTKIIIYVTNTNITIAQDSDINGIQKMHKHLVPRVGGVAIFISLLTIIVDGYFTEHVLYGFGCGLILSTSFVFAGGLIEDLSKSVSPLIRIIFTVIAVSCAIFLTNSMPLIKHLGGDSVNILVFIDIISFLITAFAVVGISNSFNIIDGYNGLSSFTAILTTLALVFIAYELGDENIMFLSLSLCAAILGFFVFNYPYGKIFLGDGGAYTIGFIISLLALNLVENHTGSISPYAALLLVVYPFTETVFTIFRRKFIHKTKSTEPDNLHLHQLVFDRCLPTSLPLIYRNSRVMPLMSMFYLPPLLVTILFYDSTLIMLLSITIYTAYYVYLYFRLVHFKTPKYLILKAKLITKI